jgi:hypothetical protein
VRGIAEGERIRVVRSEERNDIATADAEAVERPRIAVNGVQKVAGGDVSAAMPETGPVAGGFEPLHQALDIQGIGKYHRLLPMNGAAQPTANNTMMVNTRYRHISTVEITNGGINEFLAYPGDIFRPVIRTARALFTENTPSARN